MRIEKSEEIVDKLTKYCTRNKIGLTDENFYSVCKKALSREEFELCILQDDISEKIDELAIKGDTFFEKEEYEKAIEVYKKGVELIPEPKNLWETKLWFTVAISDSYWLLKKYKEALEYLDDSLKIEGGKENGFVRLRRGQVLFELSRLDEAKLELETGYELNGEELFEGENKKYFELVEEK